MSDFQGAKVKNYFNRVASLKGYPYIFIRFFFFFFFFLYYWRKPKLFVNNNKNIDFVYQLEYMLTYPRIDTCKKLASSQEPYQHSQ